MQAKLIRKRKPWEESTGAKTSEGKARVSRNAYKGNLRGQLRELARELRKQRRMIETLEGLNST
jgi:hypothetical protein